MLLLFQITIESHFDMNYNKSINFCYKYTVRGKELEEDNLRDGISSAPHDSGCVWNNSLQCNIWRQSY